MLTVLEGCYKIGQRFSEGLSAEDARAVINPNRGLEIYLSLSNPRSTEVQSIASGVLEFRLVSICGVSFLCLCSLEKFQGFNGFDKLLIPWQEMPLRPAEFAVRPDLSFKQGHELQVSVIVVDADSQIVKGLRTANLSQRFTNALIDILEGSTDQITATDRQYSQQLQQVYEQFPIPGMIAESSQAKQMTCICVMNS
ncbi:MAG: hypothetical protein ACFBSC_13925 [Microcoleaceae cyanobacterium]